MTFEEYAEAARRTQAGFSSDVSNIVVAALGLAGESGEVADHVKKALAQGHEIDCKKVSLELGDILWYVVLMVDALYEEFGFAVSPSDIPRWNIEKLKERYPEGFDSERSRNR